MTLVHSRRRFFTTLGSAGLVALPFFDLLRARPTRAASGFAERCIIFYFPDGIVGATQDGAASPWPPSGSEHDFTLSGQLAPLQAHRSECLFFSGLSMGPTDSGSHPGGAKKLLTAADGGRNESIDHRLARTAGSDAPFPHLYLGAMANQNGASGDKHISYVQPEQTISPIDDPRQAFDHLFEGYSGGTPSEPDPDRVTVIDAALADIDRLRSRLGSIEKTKLDQHLEALREVEKRIKGIGGLPSCDAPGLQIDGLTADNAYDPRMFPAILAAQRDLLVLAMSCGLSRVAVLQASHHTSDLLMSAFEGTAMHESDPSQGMRSHQASHYGATHDPAKREYAAYLAQRTWWVEQFAGLLDALAERPDPYGEGSMLDNSVVLLCSEVSDGNTHLHDDMPFVLAGRAGGAISPGRFLRLPGHRHGDLLSAMGAAMGEDLGPFGDAGSGPLPGVLDG